MPAKCVRRRAPRRMFRRRGFRGFGAEVPGLSIELPPLPGYVTQEIHDVALDLSADLCEKKTKRNTMIAAGAGVIALIAGVLIGRAMK